MQQAAYDEATTVSQEAKQERARDGGGSRKTMDYRWAYLQLVVAVLRDSLCHFEIWGKVVVVVHLSARRLWKFSDSRRYG